MKKQILIVVGIAVVNFITISLYVYRMDQNSLPKNCGKVAVDLCEEVRQCEFPPSLFSSGPEKCVSKINYFLKSFDKDEEFCGNEIMKIDMHETCIDLAVYFVDFVSRL